MKKLTKIYTIRFSEKQAETLEILKVYDVNISKFIRSAIAEKIKKEWKEIKETKEKIKIPF